MIAAELLRKSIRETEASLAYQRAALAELEAADNLGDAAAGNWISLGDAACMLRVSKNAARKRLRSSGIETVMRGGRVFIWRDDLSKLYARRPATLATPPATLAIFSAASPTPIIGIEIRANSEE
jgi:hypothetical protein